jgi:hypothetical protein
MKMICLMQRWLREMLFASEEKFAPERPLELRWAEKTFPYN